MKRNRFLLKATTALVIALTALPVISHAEAYDPNDDYQQLDVKFYENQKPDQGFYINAAANYVLETVGNPTVGSVGGEWSVMDLARGAYTGYDYVNKLNGSSFNSTYLSNLNDYVTSVNGNLSSTKSTEYSRVILALSALKKDAHHVTLENYDFINRLEESFKFSYKQGINGPIWELIALNTADYEFSGGLTGDDVNTKGKMLDYILNKELSNGGWALFGTATDPDITGMALQALAPYYNHLADYEATGATIPYGTFMGKVERAVLALANIQADNGGYNAWGNVNAESTVQVVVALTELNMNPKATAISLPTIGETAYFNDTTATQDGVTTGNMIDALYTFFAPGSGIAKESAGFKHVTTGYDGGGGSGAGVNAMATDQALYGLIAYDRYKNGENALYDMTDAQENYTAKQFSLTYVENGNSTTEHYSPYAAVNLKDTIERWNTKADGTGTSYLATDTLSMPEENITLYAE
ncbi:MULTISPECIES: hypothetical protein [Rummeliibacillus]|uniref:hypothetical protein n=1 Tax=Rummeliibacillus TaxID=648802 RepID=UPI0011B5606D|nr:MULTISPECIES: hypothetical protein [Rummeliibacillus]